MVVIESLLVVLVVIEKIVKIYKYFTAHRLNIYLIKKDASIGFLLLEAIIRVYNILFDDLDLEMQELKVGDVLDGITDVDFYVLDSSNSFSPLCYL